MEEVYESLLIYPPGEEPIGRVLEKGRRDMGAGWKKKNLVVILHSKQSAFAQVAAV